MPTYDVLHETYAHCIVLYAIAPCIECRCFVQRQSAQKTIAEKVHDISIGAPWVEIYICHSEHKFHDSHRHICIRARGRAHILSHICTHTHVRVCLVAAHNANGRSYTSTPRHSRIINSQPQHQFCHIAAAVWYTTPYHAAVGRQQFLICCASIGEYGSDPLNPSTRRYALADGCLSTSSERQNVVIRQPYSCTIGFWVWIGAGDIFLSSQSIRQVFVFASFFSFFLSLRSLCTLTAAAAEADWLKSHIHMKLYCIVRSVPSIGSNSIIAWMEEVCVYCIMIAKWCTHTHTHAYSRHHMGMVPSAAHTWFNEQAEP